jgi:DNA-binding MarR family transcriptional regulator
VYYPCVTEPSAPDDLTGAATDLLRLFRDLPRRDASSVARDLTLGQIRLLILLRHEGPMPMGKIAEVFDLSSTAATGFVERIERHGLVERQHRSDDRRVVECVLADPGDAFVDEISGFRLEAVKQALAELDPTELAEFHRLLRTIHERRGCAR